MRILLADDHNMVRDALKSYIERLEPDAEIVSADSFTTAYKSYCVINSLPAMGAMHV